MKSLTTMEELRNNIFTLACVEESVTPFVSCYLNLEKGDGCGIKTLDDRLPALRSTITGEALSHFDAAIQSIKAYLASQLMPDAKGVAIFCRHYSTGRFLLPMQFAAPLPDWIAVYDTPHLFHLMAMKDNYHRYVVLMATRNWVRILEVNLGAATVQTWTRHPGLRERVGREITKEHYESRNRAHTSRFLKEQIELLGDLMKAGKHTHLILAGDPRLTGEIRQALPKSVAAKLIDTIPAASRDAESDVVTATLSAFVDWEEQESQAVAARFVKGIRTQGRAVAGAAACLEALRQRRADTVLLAQGVSARPGWLCSACYAIRITPHAPDSCPACGEKSLRQIDPVAEITRLAGQQECPIEVVEHCDPLMALGGIGCLLRF